MNLSDLSQISRKIPSFPDDVQLVEMKHLNILGLRDHNKLKIEERLRIDWIMAVV